jgi:hypothetical protein
MLRRRMDTSLRHQHNITGSINDMFVSASQIAFSAEKVEKSKV